MAAQTAQNQLQQPLQDTVTALLTGRVELAEELATYLNAQDDEPRKVGVEDLVLASCRSNVTVMLDYIARSVPLESITASAELLGYTRTMVRSGLSHDSVMRGYRRGTTFLVQKWVTQVGELGLPADVSVQLISHGSGYLLGWLEVMLEQLSMEFRAEMSRLSLERSHARLDDITALLRASGDDDLVGVDQRLGYRLARSHLAMVLYDATRGPAHEDALDAAVRSVTGRLGVSTRLAVHADTRTMWCWVPWPADREVDVSLVDVPVLAGVGRVGTGIAGFRRSHREAVDALRVARTADAATPSVVKYDEVDVVALCTADVARAREFIQFELGALAGDDPITARQRNTLSAFYSADSNFRATATQLGLHHNTVRYRLEQIEHRLGRGVQQRRLSLELALRLAEYIEPQR